MWAGYLSETWERFISQNVADALVNRGTLEVQVTMMKVVARITDEDNKQFQESYKRCSRWARRHDKDAALIYSAPRSRTWRRNTCSWRSGLTVSASTGLEVLTVQRSRESRAPIWKVGAFGARPGPMRGMPPRV